VSGSLMPMSGCSAIRPRIREGILRSFARVVVVVGGAHEGGTATRTRSWVEVV
jgi:hypothetical protein